ncbi:hypothetical protein RRG08_021103 [Elysia crispata]|uniref:Uncharacterized protein n=1 Tax=Elysia crispata TaxID=231223 RepID=A0AAE0Z5V2_9GAST|nr:hypothetical protein RRG08_021103 [Elysia crispata]
MKSAEQRLRFIAIEREEDGRMVSGVGTKLGLIGAQNSAILSRVVEIRELLKLRETWRLQARAGLGSDLT